MRPVWSWLGRQPRAVIYVVGYFLLVLLLLTIVEYRARPAAQAVTSGAGGARHGAPASSARHGIAVGSGRHDAPPHRTMPAAPRPVPPLIVTTRDNPPAPPRPAHATHPARSARAVALNDCGRLAALHLEVLLSGPSQWAPSGGAGHVGSGAIWDLGAFKQGDQLTLVVEGTHC